MLMRALESQRQDPPEAFERLKNPNRSFDARHATACISSFVSGPRSARSVPSFLDASMSDQVFNSKSFLPLSGHVATTKALRLFAYSSRPRAPARGAQQQRLHRATRPSAKHRGDAASALKEALRGPDLSRVDLSSLVWKHPKKTTSLPDLDHSRSNARKKEREQLLPGPGPSCT